MRSRRLAGAVALALVAALGDTRSRVGAGARVAATGSRSTSARSTPRAVRGNCARSASTPRRRHARRRRRGDRGRGRADRAAGRPARRQGRQARGQADRRQGRVAGCCASRPRAAGSAFRSYSEPGGIRDELIATAARYPKLAKLVTIGRTTPGQADPGGQGDQERARDCATAPRPATVYVGAQHAREWITVEMNRRLLHHVLDSYGTDPTITNAGQHAPSCGSCRSPTPTATTTRSPRATGCGARTCATTTATARSPASTASTSTATSPTSGATTTRAPRPTRPATPTAGPAPNSEPETRALDGLFRRVGFEFFINYHSAAELLLYGVGWQVSTPSPDDVIYKAMVGDDAHPAVPGLRPRHLGRALHDQRRHRLAHDGASYGTLGFTPEMTTCETASDVGPRRRVAAGGLRQRLHLPRRRRPDPGRVRQEHPVRAGDRPVGARPGRPGVGRRPDHAGLRHRPVRRVVRHAASRSR